jgi:hypothetical protein
MNKDDNFLHKIEFSSKLILLNMGFKFGTKLIKTPKLIFVLHGKNLLQ